jgi:hypothetical protein
VTAFVVTVSALETGVSVTGGAGGQVGFSSTVGTEAEGTGTVFDSETVEGTEAGVSTVGGFAGAATAISAGFASAAVVSAFFSDVLMLVQGGSRGQTKWNKARVEPHEVNESSHS